jgi:plastocyanin
MALLAIASIAASGCSGSNLPANGSAPTLSSYAAAAGAGVNIVNSTYRPKTLKTHVGTTVKFLDEDDTAHTVTADDGSFSSAFLTKNRSYKHTFSKPGKYPYHCKIHPFMTGTVIVTK